jgi:hypothetical protein
LARGLPAIPVNSDSDGWDGPLPSNPVGLASVLERQADVCALAAEAGLPMMFPVDDRDEYCALLRSKAAALRARVSESAEQHEPPAQHVSIHQRRMELAAASLSVAARPPSRRDAA